MLSTGATRADVLQAVASAQRAEQARRSEVRGQNALTAATHPGDDRPPQIAEPALLWGDEAIPERTIDRYIHDAKELLVDEGMEAIEDRARLLGKQVARGDRLYALAIANKRYHTAFQVWEAQNRLFKLGEIAATLLPPPDEIEGSDASRPMVDVVTDGPQLPSESRAKLIEEARAGLAAELAKKVGS